MNNSPSPRTRRPALRPYLLLVCLLLSLLVHVLLVILLLRTEPQDEVARQPTIIHLVDYPDVDQQPEAEQRQRPSFEIDQQPSPHEPDLQVESERKAEQDQRVEREQAPAGEDARDQTTAAETSPPAAPAESPPVPKTPPPSVVVRPEPQAPAPAPDPREPDASKADTVTTRTDAIEPPAEGEEIFPPQLTRDQLFPTSSIMQQIAQGSQADQNRIRERDDVEIGDTVWLNLQHDRLVSFFRRFHDRVERVWSYPTEAAANGIEGTLELLIIVTREGHLVDVDLRHSSGSDILDFEAIQAVYRAAPFGPLGRHYPHEQLRIRAHFRYRITGRYIYGR